MTLDRDTLFIDGEWAAPASGGLLEVVSPHTEEVVATVPEGTTGRHRRRGRRGASGLRRGTVAADVAEGADRRRRRPSRACTPAGWARWPT